MSTAGCARCSSECTGTASSTYVGRVGTGIGAEVEKTLRQRLRAVESKREPLRGTGCATQGSERHWAKPKLVAEIEFAGWTGGARCARLHSKDCAKTNLLRR